MFNMDGLLSCQSLPSEYAQSHAEPIEVNGSNTRLPPAPSANDSDSGTPATPARTGIFCGARSRVLCNVTVSILSQRYSGSVSISVERWQNVSTLKRRRRMLTSKAKKRKALPP